MGDTVIVINLHSSGSRSAIERLPGLLESHGIAYEDLIVANDHARLCKRVKRAVRSGAKRLLVGGGDGTMAAAMQYLAHSETTLGLLPLGTGNSFAQTMQIPHDLDAAIGIIASGHQTRVDLGRVNDTYFANFATVGLAAEIAHETPNDLKARFGPLAYAIAGVRPLLRQLFTSLGYWPALTLLGIAVVALLLRRTASPWLPAAFVASHAISQGAVLAIKPIFHRSRPDRWLVRHEVDMSYPSGHSATALTFFLGLAILVWHARIPIPFALAASLCFGICALGIPWSRLALGAHFVTDVFGGLLFGSGWLAASIAVYLSYAR